MSEFKIKVATDFSKTPGPRHRIEGDFSGEQFKEEILFKKLELAFKEKKVLDIDLDGTFGYGTSFLEEAFGGASRKFGADKVLNHIKFKSEEEPYLIDDIYSYIEDTRRDS